MEVTATPTRKVKTKTVLRKTAHTSLVQSHFVPPHQSPYAQVSWERRASSIKDSQGQVVFEMRDVEVPSSWSQLATDIVVSKYFRRAGIPETGSEKSVRQLVFRITHTIRQFGRENDYFQSDEEAEIFENELAHILLQQKGAFNSPFGGLGIFD